MWERGWMKTEQNVNPDYYFLKDFYLFLEGKGRRKKGRETSVCGCISRDPHWRPGLQPRHVP